MKRVASSLIINENDQVLLLKRSPGRKFAGLWWVLSGHIEENEDPLDCAIREIGEEIGSDVKVEFVKSGGSFVDDLPEGSWEVYPFLFRFISGELKIDSEHSEFAWVDIDKIDNYNLRETIKKDFKVLGLI